MKPILEDIKTEKGSSSFYAYRFRTPFFEFKWHYHPEYELTYIVKGNGYRLVGSSYEYFKEGDLVLLGPNLPHTWAGKSISDSQSEAIVIQFSQDFITPFLRFKESNLITKMLGNSLRGISFEDHKDVLIKITDMVLSKGMDRILKLISVLEVLTLKQSRLISSNTYHIIVSKKNETRINKVCLFIQNNFSEKISLKQLAELIYVTESNFCKFFKKATGKTFSDYLNEIRINEACRLLRLSDKSISQISIECGFDTLSYFNKVFLNKKQVTPSTYRKKKQN